MFLRIVRCPILCFLMNYRSICCREVSKCDHEPDVSVRFKYFSASRWRVAVQTQEFRHPKATGNRDDTSGHRPIPRDTQSLSVYHANHVASRVALIPH